MKLFRKIHSSYKLILPIGAHKELFERLLMITLIIRNKSFLLSFIILIFSKEKLYHLAYFILIF